MGGGYIASLAQKLYSHGYCSHPEPKLVKKVEGINLLINGS
jgi:hypothetical protein